MKRNAICLGMIVLLLFSACGQGAHLQPDNPICTEPGPVEAALPTTLPANEQSTRAGQTWLSFYLDGNEVARAATLYVGDGYSIYVFDEGWELDCNSIGGYAADIWKYVSNNVAKLCAVKLVKCSVSDAQLWAQAQFPEYDLIEDKRGGLGGCDTDGHRVDVCFFSAAEDVLYALIQMYPLEDAEDIGVYLTVMSDTFEAS